MTKNGGRTESSTSISDRLCGGQPPTSRISIFITQRCSFRRFFLGGTIVGVITANTLGKFAITKLELLDQQHVKFHFLWGNHAVCKISDIETLEMEKNMEENSEEIPKGKGQVKKTSLIVIANFKDLKGRNYWRKRLWIDTHMTKVDHTDLLKSVMQGDVEEVQKFVFVEGGRGGVEGQGGIKEKGRE